MILDIDVFSTKVFKPTDDAIWSEFEALRDIENKCFFESLTPEKVKTHRWSWQRQMSNTGIASAHPPLLERARGSWRRSSTSFPSRKSRVPSCHPST